VLRPNVSTEGLPLCPSTAEDACVDIPSTRYAQADDGAHIAYKISGAGPTDLVYIPGWNSRLDLSWEQPLDAKFLSSLASFSRLIMLDRRGSGLSDPLPRGAPPPLEVLMGDISAVLDGVGSESATIFGEFEGGPLCTLFAATYPVRTRALVLYGTYARGAWAPDYPWAWTDQQLEEELADYERAVLGKGPTHSQAYLEEWAEEMVPSLAHEAWFQPWLRKVLEAPGAPGSLVALARFEHGLDVRAVLPTIHVPTLVINRADDRVAELEEGRWLASQIPGATFVELPGQDHPPWAGDQDSILNAIRAFLGVSPQPTLVNRVLATVLFTDIVDSTHKAHEFGDARWKDLLASHDERAKAEIARHAGTFVDSAGDGIFARFEGPARAVRCAQAISASLRELGLEIRAGCHTGEVELAGKRVRGIAVHIGARVGALAGPSEVLVSQTVKDLVAGSGLAFEDAGEHELKGVPDRWRLYRVVDGKSDAVGHR
jgi:class 3 adenylate cyclase